MEYRIRERTIEVIIPAGNAGKFRFKKRDHNLAFGETFPTRTESFDNKTYLEWQIGYDVEVRAVAEGEAQTCLNAQSFVASNGKTKYPYELSELFFQAVKKGLIAKEHARSLLDEIRAYRELIDEKAITVENRISATTLNGINYQETCIRLPTLFMLNTQDGTQIEVAIKQQQYASGVQPMIYFCIPLTSFANSAQLVGRASVSTDKLVYTIDESNAGNLSNLMRVFGMASERHKHDTMQIIRIIINSV